jgi:hypothetical protein
MDIRTLKKKYPAIRFYRHKQYLSYYIAIRYRTKYGKIWRKYTFGNLLTIKNNKTFIKTLFREINREIKSLINITIDHHKLYEYKYIKFNK